MLSEMLPMRQPVLSGHGCSPHVSTLADSCLLALLCHQLLWHRSCSISVTLAEKILEAMFPDPKVLTKIREREQPTLDHCQMSSKAGLLDILEAGREPSYMERLRRINCLRACIGSLPPACFTTLCLSTLCSCTL